MKIKGLIVKLNALAKRTNANNNIIMYTQSFNSNNNNADFTLLLILHQQNSSDFSHIQHERTRAMNA